MTGWRWTAFVAAGCIIAGAAGAQKTSEPRDLGKKPPKGAIVLFNGSDTSAWVHRGSNEPIRWKVIDGALEVVPGTPDIVTKEEFGDYLLHVEFWLPYMPQATSQARANSGVYNHGRYEIQVLDSYQNETYKYGGCGALYGVKDPDVSVPRKPEEWQSYDITFRAPRFDKEGNMTEKPRLVTVYWNGVKIHQNVEIPVGSTVSGMGGPAPARGPILLQDHGNPVRYRNIWIKELKLK
jgi:hypothetical protein